MKNLEKISITPTEAFRLKDSAGVFYKKMWMHSWEQKRDTAFDTEGIQIWMSESEEDHNQNLKGFRIGRIISKNELSILHTGITEVDLWRVRKGTPLPMLVTCEMRYDKEQEVIHYHVAAVEKFPEWDEFPPSYFRDIKKYCETKGSRGLNPPDEKTMAMIEDFLKSEIGQMLKDRGIDDLCKSIFQKAR